MANVLAKDKQITVIAALAEGSSIRSIERMTGINRNTIMNLGVRVGQGSAALLDYKMRDLTWARPFGKARLRFSICTIIRARPVSMRGRTIQTMQTTQDGM